jgi:transposase
VDETSFLAAAATHPTEFATGITDLTPGRPARLLEVKHGRSGAVLAGWLTERDQAWKQRVATASLDPFRGYAVRHEALIIRVGCKDSPPLCRGRPVKLRAA